MDIKPLWAALRRSVRARGLRDIADSKNWALYLDGETIEREGVQIPYPEIMAYAEQLIYRTTRCAECVAAGVCPHCGCTMPKAAMVAGKTCPKARWGAMLPAADWQALKDRNTIRFRVEERGD